MKIPKGIEGDYIETRKNHLFFDVKGYHHPKDRRICFIRFYPDKNGDRVKCNTYFKKIYDLNERYNLLRERFPQYLFFSKPFDLELQGVKNEDIKKIYTPRDCFRNLEYRNDLNSIEKKSKDLCELFISEGNLDKELIGISGSLMVGLNKIDSDIDIVIYGTENSLNFQIKLENIFDNSEICKIYTLEEFRTHYDWRVGGSDIQFEDFLKSEKRKLHQGKYFGLDFYIRYIKSPEDWKGSYYDYQYINLGRIKIKAEILDSINSIFTPCSYKIKCIKILEKKLNSADIDIKKINEINSFRGRFCEQARNGEIVLIEGKLENVKFREEDDYYRILLSDQVKDKMIILD